jgi:hypothetical protein
MSESYNHFRSQQLALLKDERPDLTYRQKLKLITEKWKEEKMKIKSSLSMDEMIALASSATCADELRRLKYSVESLDETLLTEGETNGEKNIMLLMNHLMQSQTPKYCMQILQKFIYDPRIFDYTLQSANLLDLSIKYNQYEIVIFILGKAPSSWVETHVFRSEDRSMLSCLFHVIFDGAERSSSKQDVMEWVRKAISRGIDPNIELSHPLYDLTMREWYRGDVVFDTLYQSLDPPSHVYSFVRYAGIYDRGRQFRHRVGITASSRIPSKHFVGETIISVLYRRVHDRRTRTFIHHLIKTEKLALNLVFMNHDISKPECYLSMMLRGRFRYIIEDGFLTFFQTPSYMFFIPSSGYPLRQLMEQISTHWDGYVYTLPSIYPLVVKLFQRGFIRPSKANLQKFFMNEGLVQNVIEWAKSRQGGWKVWIRSCSTPLDTPLVRFLCTPPLLERILFNSYWRSEFTFDYLIHVGEEHYREVILPNIPLDSTPLNEWFVNGVDVKEYMNKYPLFMSEDRFVFCEEDFQYLIESRNNPFTRKPLTDAEWWRVCKLKYLFEEWWFLIDPPQQFEEIKSSVALTVKLLTELIDRFLDQSPYFVYSDRLTDLIGKIDSPSAVHATYVCLMTNPSLIMSDANDVFSQLCIPFKAADDSLQTENVNFYYGTRIAQAMDGTTPLEGSRMALLCWILNILETTQTYEPVEKLNGRVFSLYTILKNFIKRLSNGT